MINKNQKIYLAGHNGMVGAAISNQLNSAGYKNLVTKTEKLDLTNQDDVRRFLETEKPTGDTCCCKSRWHLCK